MEMRQKQVIEAYQRVQQFVTEHPLPTRAGYGLPGAMLDEVVTRLASHCVVQASGRRRSRAETVRQRALERQLRWMHLRPIGKIARAVREEAPGLHLALRLPAEEIPLTRLLAAANAIRQTVAAREALFVAHGRPADFLGQMDRTIDALRGSLLERSRQVGLAVGARAGIAEEIRRGRNVVEMLDAIVTTAFVDDDEVLGKWRAARRVQRRPGGRGPARQQEGDAGVVRLAA